MKKKVIVFAFALATILLILCSCGQNGSSTVQTEPVGETTNVAEPDPTSVIISTLKKEYREGTWDGSPKEMKDGNEWQVLKPEGILGIKDEFGGFEGHGYPAASDDVKI